MSSTKVGVNGASSATSSELQDQITLALLANGGVGRIQNTLQQRLDETGWTEKVREYATMLFRTGECTTFFEALNRVKSQIKLDGIDGASSKANGAADELTIPTSAIEGGVEAVRKELAQVCEVKK